MASCSHAIRIRRAAAALILSFATRHAHAQTAVSAEFGRETRGGIGRAALGLSFPTGLRGQLGATAWVATLNVDVARWHATSAEYGHANISDLGVTPQLRLLPSRNESLGLFIDLGIGAHAVSAHDVGGRQLGTTFQFGEYLGIGTAFGERRQFAASLRLLHESNCGASRSNSGLTSLGLRFEYTVP
jgi:lipid A 3-O-deacylase